MIAHILDRAALHILMGAGVYLIAFFIMRWAMRRNPELMRDVIPAMLAAGFIGWREAWDVGHGQPLVKAFTDYASWIIGTGLATWGLRRFRKERE